jgi:hypothetical protein
MRERPSYYAVIPANVRYAKGLSANAKLLYGEITALCSKEGYCWAGNRYFADLYDTTARTALNWINELRDGGYIKLDYKYVEGTREIETRHIRLVEGGGEKSNTTCGKGAPPSTPAPPAPADKAAEEAETPPISDGNNAAPAETAGSVEGGGEKNNTTYGKNFQGVVKKITGGGEENQHHSITSINKNINKESSSSGPVSGPAPEQSAEKKTEEEADINKTPNKDLRKLFLEADRTLVFDDLFYVNACQFLEDRDLPDEYLSWLCEQCKKQNPRILMNYYYKLFFSNQMVELYKREKKPAEIPKRIYETCPVCGESVNLAEAVCPRCRFEMKYKADGGKVKSARERLKERAAEINRLRESGAGTAELLKGIAEMNRRSSA